MLNHITILRTLAVMLVLIFHFNNKILISGYIGVDIFFVISGYLISSIALKRVHDGQSLKQFYIKRIMRIFPVLLFISFSIIFSLSLIEYLEVETLQMFRDTITFSSNLRAEKINLDYFGNNDNNYLLHLWSISIELQFYLFFPLLMINKKIKESISYIVMFFVFVSFLMLSLELSYYDSLGRMFAFSIGMSTYLVKDRVKQNNYIYFLSLIFLLAISNFDLDVLTYPNYNNVVVVLLSSSALLFGNINQKKRYKPFIFVGLISYSIYLWHYPLFLFFNQMNVETNIINISVLLSLLSLLSVFTYFIIEKRFLSKNYGNYTILLIVLPLLCLIGEIYYKKNQTINIPIINKIYEKITLNPILFYSDLARTEVGKKYPNCLDNKGELLTDCSTARINNTTKTALVLGNSFVHSGGLVFLDQITAHYNVKSDFYYLFGDRIQTDKLYTSIKEQKYDYLILYYPWDGIDKENIINEYKELSKHTQIIFIKGTKYNKAIDKKQLFRFNNLFVDDENNAYQCICQEPFTTDKGYAVIDSALNELDAKSIDMHELQKNNNGDYICSDNNIALYLDAHHINNYAGEFFAKIFIKRDMGKDIFTQN